MQNVESVYALSPMQQSMLVRTLQFPGLEEYTEQVTWTVAGALDAGALGRAWRRVVDRHAILRTTFFWEGLDQPLQVVRGEAAAPFETHDWSEVPDRGREERFAEFLAADRARGFDLGAAPLARLTCIRLGEDEHRVVWSYHHLLLDGWSSALGLRELHACYAALAEGREPELGRPGRYQDFISWMGAQDESGAREFWGAQLDGFAAPTRLALERPAEGEEAPEVLEARLPEALVARVREATRRHGVTLNTVLQGAWGLLLAQYSGEADVIFGAIVSGRPPALPGVETALGMFINTVPVRVRVPPEQPVAAWLRELQAVQTRARDFDWVAVPRIQSWSEVPQPEKLYDTVYVFQNVPDVETRGARAAGTDWGGFSRNAAAVRTGYGLMPEFVPRGGVEVNLMWDAARFDRAFAERVPEHLAALLEAFAADPERALASVSPLAPEERRRVLEEWNATGRDYPRGECVHGLFAAQAARTPDAPAVASGEETLSYAELDARANRLANHLRRLGVGPETRVGVCVERGPEMFWGVLGVLKAGGAYVPLDPAYPEDRLAFMVEDAGARVLLAQARVADRLPAGGAAVVRLDADRAAIDAESAAPPETGVGEGNLAYVVYTSGTTGRPKGVQVEHRAWVNAYRAWEEAYALRPAPTAHLQMASFSFDVFGGDLVRALCSGGKLVPVPMDTLLDPPALYALMRRHEVDTAEFVPAVLRSLFQHLRETGERLDFMRLLIAGSDAWYVREHEEIRALCAPDTRCVNSYGVAEATVDSTWYESGRERLSGDAMVPIGRPFANTRIYVLDGRMQPSSPGVPGELFIGGAGLARGYLGRPELTAEKFVPDAFPDRPGARMYRTGDRARRLADGSLEFLGRADHQVKIRGFRIEPAEVAAQLLEHPAVREALVLVREDRPGEKRLVAYLVPEAGAEVASPDLRDHLRERLPDYMVPSAFVVVDAFPLTPNGKVDRRALPAPEGGAEDEGFAAPRTPVEEVLAAIWAEVLGVDRVGVADDFFRLGGHSLLATRVISRVRRALEVEVPIRALFESPTVEAMAERVEALRGAGAGEQAPPLVPVPRDGPLPLSFAQQRLWFIEQLDPGDPAYNLPVALRLRGPLDVGALERSVAEVARRHETLRTVFRPAADGDAAQTVLEPGPFAFRRVDLAGVPDAAREARVRELAREEAAAPFDLSAGPLLRGALLRLADDEAVALFTVHHIVSDEWSTPILVREVSALYGAFARGEPSPLPELPVQYADYAAWQRRVLTGETLDRQLAYWRGRLAGAPPLLELPTDRARPAASSPRGGVRAFHLSAELADALRELSRTEGATLFMTLLAGFQALLARYAGTDDVLVGTPVAGRTRLETEGLIGFFVNTLVLRADLSADPDVRGLVAQARERMLEAQTHQDLPFERLVDELRVERSFGHTPLFQVMFTLADLGGEALRLGEVEVEPLATETGATPFDLALVLSGEGGGLRGSVEFRSELWDAATVDRMTEHFRVLLEGMAARPASRVSALPLLSADERELVVERWNSTACDFPRHLTLHGAFEAQAARTPRATAVVFEGGELSYAELDARASSAAARLRALGVGPETRVAISVRRGPEMPAGILGALKAGAAYVPLDPGYPEERLRWVLEDCGARVLLTQASLAERFGWFGGEVVALDAPHPPAPSPTRGEGENDDAADEGALSRSRTFALSHSPSPQNLAYVVYTSGSTGRPKGVAVSHRAVVNYAVDMAGRMKLRGDDRVLQFASLGFDVVVEELFPTWLAGAAVVLAGGDLFSPPELTRAIGRHGVTGLELPTAYWHEWTYDLAHGGGRVPECVRWVIVGGERIAPERLAEWAGLGVPLVHVFGLTETACTSTTLRLEAGEDGGARRHNLPVGTPHGNVRLYVLDPRGEPVPAGVRGELFIGGEGLARGYLGRPGPTAERFLPDPFGRGAGARLYRTGDRVRRLSDGSLEFLGRTDFQVKIRGFRIETGEVEAVLTDHPAVREAFVMAREDAPGDRRLAAYLVGEGAGGPDVETLRVWLRDRLPDYMVPADWVVLDALPLTANGKTDRAALPAPDASGGEREYTAPRTATEEVLADLWQGLLGVGRVGVHDDFFALGGHSLLATRVVTRTRRMLHVEVPLRVLFETPTVAELAAALARLEPRPGQTEKAAKMLRLVAKMSPEEVQRVLRERQAAGRS
ncbi:MAG TPA: amino acid adenylation domain-containing protein [Longimicrobiaceae bacterium]|nr:amino acid adenylation domain-containing protein [Longimicrobiaceae bacterium]